MSVDHDEVVDDAGDRADFWVVRRPSFVLVVPRLRGTGRIGLVHRFRYPVGLFFWEFPQRRLAGTDPADVDATASALVRDLADGGSSPIQLQPLGRFFEAYGFSDHLCHCYVAEIGAEHAPADDARGSLRWQPMTSVLDQLVGSDIADGATAAALGLLLARDRRASA
jgi:hypothetical protein